MQEDTLFQALYLVLDTLTNFFGTVRPIIEELHILEFFAGALFVLLGLRLLVPMFGSAYNLTRGK